MKLNPAWISHPYEVSYLFLPGQSRAEWSRKRRLKLRRRYIKRVLPTRNLHDLFISACPACDGRPGGHFSYCNYANGN